MNRNSDTIASIATGFNNSGIGIVRISGPDSFAIIQKIFADKKGERFTGLESHRVYYGYIFDEDTMVDEVIVITMKAPRSFTAEDTVEIDCHGGNLVLRKVLKTVIKNGARTADPGEFTKRAFLNGRIDLSEAEAVMDLIGSKNSLALENSLRQLTGRLHDEIVLLREDILYETAKIEAAIDDPEHYSLLGYSEILRDKITSIIKKIEALASSFDNGRIIKEGIHAVIIGKPNVGKSSLLNLLSGYERAIVTDIPGTTRDIIEESIDLDGLNLIISDTAGIRSSEDRVEKIGVEKAIKQAEDSDLLILMLDSSSELDEDDKKLLSYIRNRCSVILLNKSDLESRTDTGDIGALSDIPCISVSVKNNTGIEEFSKLLHSMFLKGDISYNDEIIITNERHRELLGRAAESLKNVLVSIDNRLPEDFYSIDLVDAYDDLGLIIGEKAEDDLVDTIFSRFCMGK
ncbi:MAG: tRNA uridine-5-carboxymethylaminomethyl(34) synthesis GTPase MnmE [Lachnospiraceae bacterium]|nr:tRNA uridine-5-carboxymethylaminomethyl(34) synthesis GTPase MnmE [Lachnospiraceae bacterium]